MCWYVFYMRPVRRVNSCQDGAVQSPGSDIAVPSVLNPSIDRPAHRRLARFRLPSRMPAGYAVNASLLFHICRVDGMLRFESICFTKLIFVLC
jgi:hypothetical protein